MTTAQYNSGLANGKSAAQSDCVDNAPMEKLPEARNDYQRGYNYGYCLNWALWDWDTYFAQSHILDIGDQLQMSEAVRDRLAEIHAMYTETATQETGEMPTETTETATAPTAPVMMSARMIKVTTQIHTETAQTTAPVLKLWTYSLSPDGKKRVRHNATITQTGDRQFEAVWQTLKRGRYDRISGYNLTGAVDCLYTVMKCRVTMLHWQYGAVTGAVALSDYEMIAETIAEIAALSGLEIAEYPTAPTETTETATQETGEMPTETTETTETATETTETVSAIEAVSIENTYFNDYDNQRAYTLIAVCLTESDALEMARRDGRCDYRVSLWRCGAVVSAYYWRGGLRISESDLLG